MVRRLKNAFGKLSIRKKLFLAVIPAMLLLFAVFFLVFRVMFLDLENNVIDSNRQFLSLMESELDSELKSVKNISTSLISNQDVKNYLSADADFTDRLKLQSVYKYDLPKTSHLSGYMFIREPDDFVYLHLSEPLGTADRSKLASYVCAQKYRDTYSAFVPFPDQNSSHADCLCHIVPVADQGAPKNELKVGGYLVMIQSRYFLPDIVSGCFSSEQDLYITDQNNRLIWTSTGKKILPAALSGGRTRQNGNYVDSAEDRLYVSQDLDTYGWVITVATPLSSVTGQMRRYETLFWVSGGIAFFLVLILLAVISRFFTNRLAELTSVIRNIQDGDLDCRYPVVYQDEISTIGSQFNRMIDEIQEYHITSAKQALNQREAELHALQSQINPHFLYNSLDCIRSTALVNNDTEAAGQIQVLSGMFRYTTGSGDRNRLVTVREEISHIQEYITMQKYRFGERFTFIVLVDERIEPMKMPKLILQPVVENAFSHGIRQMPSGGKLTVTGALDEQGAVCFTVSDNGVGIGSERLSFLQEQLSANPLVSKDTPFMALVNTNDRLKIAYGPEYGISIESQEGMGTTVRIRIPAIAD